MEPGVQLQQLQLAIIRGEVGLHPSAAAASPAEHVDEVAGLLLAGKVVPVLGGDAAELASQLATTFDYPAGEASDLTRVAQYVALTKGSGPLYDELHAMLTAEASPSPVH